jgi:hypothetical protein
MLGLVTMGNLIVGLKTDFSKSITALGGLNLFEFPPMLGAGQREKQHQKLKIRFEAHFEKLTDAACFSVRALVFGYTYEKGKQAASPKWVIFINPGGLSPNRAHNNPGHRQGGMSGVVICS